MFLGLNFEAHPFDIGVNLTLIDLLVTFVQTCDGFAQDSAWFLKCFEPFRLLIERIKFLVQVLQIFKHLPIRRIGGQEICLVQIPVLLCWAGRFKLEDLIWFEVTFWVLSGLLVPLPRSCLAQ